MGAAAVLPSRMRSRFSVLGLTPSEVSMAEGHDQERHRRVALTAAVSVLAKLLSVGTALVSVPLALQCIGAKRIGAQGDRKFALEVQSVVI